MLTISQVSKAFAGRTLFKDASLQVNRGDRVGLSDRMGRASRRSFPSFSAKRLRMKAGFAGEIGHDRISAAGAIAPAGEETVLELACAVAPEVAKAQRIIRTTPEDSAQHHEALHSFDEHGGWQLEQKQSEFWLALPFANRISSGPRKP